MGMSGFGTQEECPDERGDLMRGVLMRGPDERCPDKRGVLKREMS